MTTARAGPMTGTALASVADLPVHAIALPRSGPAGRMCRPLRGAAHRLMPARHYASAHRSQTQMRGCHGVPDFSQLVKAYGIRGTVPDQMNAGIAHDMREGHPAGQPGEALIREDR